MVLGVGEYVVRLPDHVVNLVSYQSFRVEVTEISGDAASVRVEGANLVISPVAGGSTTMALTVTVDERPPLNASLTVRVAVYRELQALPDTSALPEGKIALPLSDYFQEEGSLWWLDKMVTHRGGVQATIGNDSLIIEVSSEVNASGVVTYSVEHDGRLILRRNFEVKTLPCASLTPPETFPAYAALLAGTPWSFSSQEARYTGAPTTELYTGMRTFTALSSTCERGVFVTTLRDDFSGEHYSSVPGSDTTRAFTDSRTFTMAESRAGIIVNFPSRFFDAYIRVTPADLQPEEVFQVRGVQSRVHPGLAVVHAGQGIVRAQASRVTSNQSSDREMFLIERRD
jgi:hypothetical protein